MYPYLSSGLTVLSDFLSSSSPSELPCSRLVFLCGGCEDILFPAEEATEVTVSGTTRQLATVPRLKLTKSHFYLDQGGNEKNS